MRYIRTANQVKIAVYDQNTCGKETVVLVHGWPLSHKIFEYQIQPLIDNGFRVVRVDLRGFGRSDAPGCGYGYNQMADDIFAVVKALGLNCFTLGGFSMGGGIVTRYMGRHNGYGVKKLLLMGAATPSFTKRPDFPYGTTRESVDALIEQAKTDRPQLCDDFGEKLLFRPHSEAIQSWFNDISKSASGIGTVQTAYALRDEDCRADLKKIKVPTGIFHGKQDEVVPFALALVQREEIKNSILYPFNDCGHGLFYDAREEFNQCLLDFLKDCY